jgi:hypothetical protein
VSSSSIILTFRVVPAGIEADPSCVLKVPFFAKLDGTDAVIRHTAIKQPILSWL